MAGVKGRDIGLRNRVLLQLSDQSLCGTAACGECDNHLGFLNSGKLGVALDQGRRDLRRIKGSQRADGIAAHGGFIKQGQHHGQCSGIGIVGKGGQDLSATLKGCCLVLENGELGCSGFGIAEKLTDLRGEVAQFCILGGIERGKGFVPVLWLRDHIAAQRFEPITQAFQKLETQGEIGIAQQCGSHGLKLLGSDGAAGDVWREQRDLAALGERHCTRGVGFDHRLNAKPKHLRQVMIGSVLRMSDEVLRDGPALRQWHALKRRREVKAHDGRVVLLRHRGELYQRCRTVSSIFAKQLDGPAANIWLGMIEQRQQTIRWEILRDVQSPESAELMRGGLGLRQEFPQLCGHCGIELTRSSTLLEQHASTAAIPIIAMRQQADEFEIGLRGEIDAGLPWQALRREAVDAAGFFVVDGSATDFGVMPIEHISRAIGSDLHAETYPRIVIGEERFIAMMTDEARAAGLEDVCDHIMLVDVRHEDAVAVFFRELIREVDARTAMRGAMAMIGDGLDIIEDVRIDVAAALTVIDAAGDDMPEMRDHAGGDEDLAVVIKVHSPRIAEAVRDDFKAVLRWMVTPNTTINVLTIFDRNLGRERIALVEDFAAIGRLAHGRACGEALAAVEPAIGSPIEAI